MRSKALTLIVGHANDLESVRSRFKMKVYAIVSISGRKETEKRTSVDENGGVNPMWNSRMQFTINMPVTEQDLILFQLKCQRSVKAHKIVGEVSVQIKDLLSSIVDVDNNNNNNNNPSAQELRCAVTTVKNKEKNLREVKGELAFSYIFCETPNSAAAHALKPPVRTRGPSMAERMARDTVVGVASTIATSFAVAALDDASQPDDAAQPDDADADADADVDAADY